MKLYYMPVSTYSQKVLLAFYEKGIEFESEIVNLMNPEEAANYREIHPFGKIYTSITLTKAVMKQRMLMNY